MRRSPRVVLGLTLAIDAGLLVVLPSCGAPAGRAAAAQAPSAPAAPSASGDATAELLARLAEPSGVDSAVVELAATYQALREEGRNVEPWLQSFLEPLIDTYVTRLGSLRPETRHRLIQLLSATEAPETEPALVAAFEAFADQRLDQVEVDLESASMAQERLRLPGVRTPLFQAYRTLRAHTDAGRKAYQSVSRALLSAPDPEWAPTLREMVSTPIPLPNEDRAEYTDQLFWQTVAAQLLGSLGDPSAARPLLGVVLDPGKSEIASTAVLALVKLGPAAVPPAAAVLEGQDEELIRLHRTQMERVDKPSAGKTNGKPRDDHGLLAAIVLGATGQPAAQAPFLRALRQASSPVDRAVLIRELAKLPPNETIRARFQQEFARIDLNVRMPPVGTVALAELAAEAVPRFYDPGVVPWLLERARRAQGDPVAQADFRRAALATAIKLAQLDQLPLIEPKIGPWGTPREADRPGDSQSPRLESDLLGDAKALLEQCKDDEACYFDALADRKPAASGASFSAIRAAYQLAIEGDEQTATQLVDLVPEIDSPTVRFAVVQAVDHLLPAGSNELAGRLEAAAPPGEPGDPIREVAYRLHGRAVPLR